MATFRFEKRGGEGEGWLNVSHIFFNVIVKLLSLLVSRAHMMPIVIIHAMTDSDIINGHFTSSEIGVYAG